MRVRELYAEALKDKHYSLQLLIEFLVQEKKVISMMDEQEALAFYIQEKYISKMNAHLLEYENKKYGRGSKHA